MFEIARGSDPRAVVRSLRGGARADLHSFDVHRVHITVSDFRPAFFCSLRSRGLAHAYDSCEISRFNKNSCRVPSHPSRPRFRGSSQSSFDGRTTAGRTPSDTFPTSLCLRIQLALDEKRSEDEVVTLRRPSLDEWRVTVTRRQLYFGKYLFTNFVT